jgi:hypothetical protein
MPEDFYILGYNARRLLNSEMQYQKASKFWDTKQKKSIF